MNQLGLEKRAQIISALVEGNSLRATCRMTGAAMNTVLKLLKEIGLACLKYQRSHLVNLNSERVECDEIWAFCYAKAKNVPKELEGEYGYGSVWTWVAMDSDTKLVITWHVGLRDEDSAYTFLGDLEPRLKNKVQLTTDGHQAYPPAIQGTFGKRVNYGVVEKQYGSILYQNEDGERRYSPNECIGVVKRKVRGRMKKKYISTSLVERQNLTMRMGMRRFTRLTNAFSKKVYNLEMAIALHFMYYNFCRPHQSLNKDRSLGRTPAMAAGVSDHQWDLGEILGLLA